MAVLAGIDEAGFGPILGPLVVSSSVFRVPDNLVWANLWELLRTSISEKRTGLKGRLLVVDSKKAFTRSLGIRHLRRTVLAVLKYLGADSTHSTGSTSSTQASSGLTGSPQAEPNNLPDLVSALCPDCLTHLREYPWYKDIDEYSLNADAGDIDVAVSMLRKDFAKKNIELLGLKSRCLEVAHYNRMIASVNNKAKVLFSAVAELMQWVIQQFPDDTIEIVVDRQGGRSHYRRELQLMFADLSLRVIHEDQNRSSYELSAGARKIRVHFVVGADSRYLPVALASMACKYLREVLVDNINRYFTGFNAELKPTAGYWKDGLRFIEDIKTHIPQIKFDTNQLIRCR
jgi:ribonuclease HII